MSDVQKLWKRSPAHSGENFNKHLNWIVSKTFSTKLKRNLIVSSKQFSYLWSQEEIKISAICQTLLLLTLFWTYFELEFYCCEALFLAQKVHFFLLIIFCNPKTVVNCFFVTVMRNLILVLFYCDICYNPKYLERPISI